MIPLLHKTGLYIRDKNSIYIFQTEHSWKKTKKIKPLDFLHRKVCHPFKIPLVYPTGVCLADTDNYCIKQMCDL